DLVCTHTRQDFVNICAGLARYRYVLLDVQRFCLKRETDEEYRELIDELLRFGLVPYSEIIDMGSEGQYYLFESNAVRVQRSEAGLAAPSLRTVLRDSATTGALVETAPPRVPDTVPAQRVPVAVLPPSPQRAAHKRFGGGVGISALLMIGIPSL